MFKFTTEDLLAAKSKLGQVTDEKMKAAQGLVTKAANDAKSTAIDMAEKAKDNRQVALLKKLNPLFPDEYFTLIDNLPNLIVIVDDAVRRDIELCNGAMGWRSFENGIEILHMYDTFVSECGLTFVPEPVCDSVYYVTPQDRTRYIRLDRLFSVLQNAKLAELSNIAYCLGAKSYRVELTEKTSSKEKLNFSSSLKVPGYGGANVSRNEDRSSDHVNTAVSTSTFVEAREPMKPELFWFKNNDAIKEVIHTICDKKAKCERREIELYGADSATMSVSTAAKVDAALKVLKANASADMESKASIESTSKMVFILEF